MLNQCIDILFMRLWIIYSFKTILRLYNANKLKIGGQHCNFSPISLK
jgi:hypothetical protein